MESPPERWRDLYRTAGSLLLAVLDKDAARAGDLLSTYSRDDVAQVATNLATLVVDYFPEAERPAFRAELAERLQDEAGS